MLYPTQQVPLQQMHINNTSRVQPLPQIPNSNIQWRKLNPQTTVTHSQPGMNYICNFGFKYKCSKSFFV